MTRFTVYRDIRGNIAALVLLDIDIAYDPDAKKYSLGKGIRGLKPSGHIDIDGPLYDAFRETYLDAKRDVELNESFAQDSLRVFNREAARVFDRHIDGKKPHEKVA